MYKISFYVPKEEAERVKTALFEAGAGRIGRYSHCAWQTLGEGQFKPLEGSQPSVGILNQIETLPEYKVEMVCDALYIDAAIAALKQSHPYETPAYNVIRCEHF